jgi:hypothetical protein
MGANPSYLTTPIMSTHTPDGIKIGSEQHRNSLLDFSDYEGLSVVDMLKSEGLDASFSNRSNIAANYGIENYKGTTEQNAQLLTYIKNDPGKMNTEDPDLNVDDEPSKPTVIIAAENEVDFPAFTDDELLRNDGDPSENNFKLDLSDGEEEGDADGDGIGDNDDIDDANDTNDANDNADEWDPSEPTDQHDLDLEAFENKTPRGQARTIRRNKRRVMRKQRRADRKEAWENRERSGHQMDLSYLKNTTQAFSQGLFGDNNVKFNNKGLLGYL